MQSIELLEISVEPPTEDHLRRRRGRRRRWMLALGAVAVLALLVAGAWAVVGARIDRATGSETGVIRAPGADTVGLLGPPKGSVTQFPLECAC